jgi:hypothetical protein
MLQSSSEIADTHYVRSLRNNYPKSLKLDLYKGPNIVDLLALTRGLKQFSFAKLCVIVYYRIPHYGPSP